MYDRILIAIDTHPTMENTSAIRRTEQIGLLTGAVVHVLHIARGHIVPEDISAGSGLGVWSSTDDPESTDRVALQKFIDHLSSAGVDAHGEMAIATEHDAADLILQRAKELDVDLLVLGHQHHRGSRTAERIIHRSPPYSVLLARAPQGS